VPLPLADSVVVEGWASLVNVRVASSAPAICGLNVTVNGVLCPAGMVTGNDKPPIVNRELVVSTAETVTFFPLAFRLPDTVPLLPTNTLPADKVVGVTVNCAATDPPVPERALPELSP
jgi:siroheme synthase